MSNSNLLQAPYIETDPGAASDSDIEAFVSGWMKRRDTLRGASSSSRPRSKLSSETPIGVDASGGPNESSLAQLQASLETSTGFSPLNPKSTLQEAFTEVSTPSMNHIMLGPDTPGPGPVPAHAHAPSRSRTPATPASTHSSLAPDYLVSVSGRSKTPGTPAVAASNLAQFKITELPPSPALVPRSPISPHTPTAAAPRLPFEEARPALFHRAFIESLEGKRFDDLHLRVFSARTRAGKPHKVRTVHARNAILCAASAKFEQDAHMWRNSAAASRTGRAEYGYDEDSDLEEREEDVEAEPASYAFKRYTVSTTRSPRSDIDFGSALSVESDGSFDELLKEAQETTQANNDTPFFTYETDSETPSGRSVNSQVTLAAQNLGQLRLAAPDVMPDGRNSPGKTEQSEVSGGASTLYITDSAYKTWHALLMYLYNDHLQFLPLRSQRAGSETPSQKGPSCSPKSMYRLADKLGLEKLKHQSFRAIQEGLNRDNIIKELFNDFTWRYPEIMEMETNVFHRYSAEPSVQAALSEKFQEIAYGQLPHSSAILDSLFKRLILAAPRPKSKSVSSKR